jgi:hypothetical protein
MPGKSFSSTEHQQMSDVQHYQPAAVTPPPPPGMSTGVKILLGCGIGCGVMLLLCCGGIVGMSWFSYSLLNRSISRDPAEIQAISAQVAEIDIPPGLTPLASFDVKIPIVDQTFLKAAVYSDEPQEQILAIGEFAESFTAVDEKTLREQIDRALTNNEHRESKEDFIVDETHTRELTIREHPAQFRIEEGHTKKTERKLIRAMGEFQGHQGVGLLFLQLDGEEYHLDQVEKILDSIH